MRCRLFSRTYICSLNCIERNEFFQKLSEACFQLENYDLQIALMLIREPIWAHLSGERCNSFASMSANAVFRPCLQGERVTLAGGLP